MVDVSTVIATVVDNIIIELYNKIYSAKCSKQHLILYMIQQTCETKSNRN